MRLPLKLAILLTVFGSLAPEARLHALPAEAAGASRAGTPAPVPAGVLVGRVTEAAGGAPIAGAMIEVRTTRFGAVTDANGRYRVSGIPAGTYSVTARRIGFTPTALQVTIADNGTATADFALTASAMALDKVVVTGAGTSTIRERLAATVSTVDSITIKRANSPNNIATALTGTAPGVLIRTQSGEPGASASILIRGSSSLSGSGQPLWVVDGIPISNDVQQASNSNGGNAGIAAPNRAADINPNDVESVEVLTGPAGAAIYGARGGNGVIMITTKSGKAGLSHVSVWSSLSNEYAIGDLNLQRSYGAGSQGNGPVAGCGTTPTSPTCLSQAWGPLLAEGTPTFNVFKEILRTGHTTDMGVSASGGTERATFFASIGQTKQQGYFVGPNNFYDRTTVRVKGTVFAASNLSVSGNISVVTSSGSGVQRGDNARSAALGTALRAPPNFNPWPLFDPITNIARGVSRPTPGLGTDTLAIGNSPLFLLYLQPNTSELSRGIGSTNVRYTPFHWLRVDVNDGVDFYSDNRFSGYPNGTNQVPTGSVDRNNFNHLEFDHSLLVTATNDVRTWWQNTATVGHNLNSRRNRSLSITGTRLIAPIPFSLNNVAASTSTESRNLAHIQSFFFQDEATFFDQAYATVGLRRDGYSTFGSENPYSIYPSARLAWNVTNFLGNRDRTGRLSYLKIRAAYGQTGKEPNLYSAVTAYSTSTVYGGGDGDQVSTVPGITSASQLGNSKLKPERETEKEFGFDFGLFDQKIDGLFTMYQKRSADIILSVATSVAQTGFTSSLLNAATLSNKGFEAQVNVHPIQRENLAWDVSFQYARNKGTTESLAAGLTEVTVGGNSGLATGVARLGYAPGVFRGTDFVRCGRGLKIDIGLGGVSDIDALCGATPGGYANGALFLLANGQPVADPTQRIIGNPNPDHTWGISSTVRFLKNFTLAARIDGAVGNDVSNGTRATENSYGMTSETLIRSQTDGTLGKNVLTKQYPTVAGPGKDVVAFKTLPNWQAWFGGLGGSSGPGAQFVEDGSYAKLREVSLSYRSTHEWVKMVGFSSLDLRLSGRNLHTWTKYTGFDPESSLQGGMVITQGIDWFNPPQTRSFGLTATFNR